MVGLTMKLIESSSLPDEFLSCTARDLHAVLGGPTLFHLEGQRSPPLFLTVLQHGNETTGFDAIQRVLRKCGPGKLPRSILLFVANVEAAAQGKRVVGDQSDYNRSWPGSPLPPSAESALMAQVIERVTSQPLFASVDMHNNTGHNPHYACVNKLEPKFLGLAELFARTAVYFRRPKGVQSIAMAEHCPAVTLECGKSGETAALEHAVQYIEDCLHLHDVPEHDEDKDELFVLKTQATVKVNRDVDFGFGQGGDCRQWDLCLRPDLDMLNFGLVKKGEALGSVGSSGARLLTAFDDKGDDIADALFEKMGDRLIARTDLIPSMATLDTDIIRQDCLFYVMEHIKLASGNQATPTA